MFVSESHYIELFLFLGVGKNFGLLMQSWRFFVFFSPDLWIKILNFSKIVHTIFMKFHTVILRAKDPLRAQRHQNRLTGMWETAIFRFLFRFSQKLSIRFERNFLQPFYTIIWSYVCNFNKFVWRIRASQREKDLRRLLYRICGSGWW